MLTVIQDVEYLVNRCDEHINAEFHQFLVDLSCSAATIACKLGINCRQIRRHLFGRRASPDLLRNGFFGHPAQSSQVELAGAQDRDRVDLVELVALGNEQVGKVLGRPSASKACWTWCVVGRVQDDELFALLFVAHGRDREELASAPDGFVQMPLRSARAAPSRRRSSRTAKAGR